jgi:hypothetical protein
MTKSFLVLFFKKEHSFWLSPWLGSREGLGWWAVVRLAALRLKAVIARQAARDRKAAIRLDE